MKITALNKLSITKLFKDEDSRFIVLTGSKVAGVYLVSMILVSYLIWVVLSLNNTYFISKGFPELAAFRSAYFDYILANIFENLTYIFAFYVLLLFAGMYIAKILIRPFKIIADYCVDSIEDKSVQYNPDLFSDFKLLTRFSDFFFRYIDEARAKKSLIPNTIPKNFTRIHQPTFDKVFFFHFFLLITILSIITSTFVSAMIYEMYEQMVNLALKTLPSDKSLAPFFQNQEYIFDSVRWFAVIIIIILYIALSINLYSRVSGAVFAFFVTMRSFMKGNHDARVHLLEYRHLRPQGRSVNKFLEQICREVKEGQQNDSDTN
jgi:hypothetical protein